MPRTRDTQRERLYSAQRVLHFSIQDRMTLAKVKVFYDKLLGSEWAARHWPKLAKMHHQGNDLGLRRPRPRVLLNPRLGRSTIAWHRGGDIEFAGGEISKVTAAHELAHWIVSTLNRDWGKKAPASHGREFAATYLTLVGHVFGNDAQDMLRKAFVSHRVSYKAKRVLSGAALEAAQERGRKLAAARAAKQLAQRDHDRAIYDALVNT